MGDGPPGFSRDSPCPAILRNLPSEPARFRLPGSHRLRPTVPGRSTNGLVSYSPASRPDRPYNPGMQARRFGLFRVRSPLLAESLLFSFPAGTEMVHFPALSSPTYGFSREYPGITPGGFPHSEIFGSTPVCGLPKLIAAYRVLHRLLAPRHPPYALSSLTILGNWRIAGIRRLRPRISEITPASETLRHYGKLPFVEYSVVKNQTGLRPEPPAVAPRGPLMPHSATAEARRARLGDDTMTAGRPLAYRATSSWPLCALAVDSVVRSRAAAFRPEPPATQLRRCPAFGRYGCRWAAVRRRRPYLVENTGLEPVTSWLQTRRSPS